MIKVIHIEYKILSLSKETLKTLKKLSKKYYLFIVTNQAGIAKNKFKKKDFYALHNFLKKYFKAQHKY